MRVLLVDLGETFVAEAEVEGRRDCGVGGDYPAAVKYGPHTYVHTNEEDVHGRPIYRQCRVASVFGALTTDPYGDAG